MQDTLAGEGWSRVGGVGIGFLCWRDEGRGN